MRGLRGSFASQAGAALVMALLAMGFVLAVSGGLVTLALIETRLSTVERERLVARAMGEVQLERTFQDLSRLPDWGAVLSGGQTSSFLGTDPRPHVPGWGVVDLASMTSRLASGASEWGADTPRWRLYSHGWSSDLLDGLASDRTRYTAAWVADDEGDGDGRSEVDANGLIGVRVEVFGPFGARQVWLATIRRVGTGLQLVSLRAPP